MASLLLRGGTVLTMNDGLEIVEGDVSIRDGRIEAVGRVGASLPRFGPRRLWRAGPAGVHPDPYPPVPDAVPRVRRRSRTHRLAPHPHLADGGRAHPGVAPGVGPPGGLRAALERHDVRADDGDGARFGCGVRGSRRHRAPGRHRQVPDGRRRRRARPAAPARAHGHRREPGAPPAVGRLRRRTDPRGIRAAVRRVVFAGPARGSGVALRGAGRAGAHARLRATGGNRHRRTPDREAQHRVFRSNRPGLRAPVRGALRLGERARTGNPRRRGV